MLITDTERHIQRSAHRLKARRPHIESGVNPPPGLMVAVPIAFATSWPHTFRLATNLHKRSHCTGFRAIRPVCPEPRPDPLAGSQARSAQLSLCGLGMAVLPAIPSTPSAAFATDRNPFLKRGGSIFPTIRRRSATTALASARWVEISSPTGHGSLERAAGPRRRS